MNEENGEPTSYNLLFVCTGNTCRSPMAAALARAAVAARGWTHVRVQSAGVAALAGSAASEPVEPVLEEVGVALGDHTAQELTPDLIDWADTILAMSPSHLQAVEARGGYGKAALITDFLEGDGAGEPVADPIGGDAAEYRTARDQIARAVDAVLDRLSAILSP